MKTNLALCLTIVLILCICCKGKRDKAYHHGRNESKVINEFRVPIQLLSSKDKLILESKATLLGISGSTLIIDYSYKTTESDEWLQDLIIIDRFRLEIIKIATTNMVETIKGTS